MNEHMTMGGSYTIDPKTEQVSLTERTAANSEVIQVNDQPAVSVESVSLAEAAADSKQIKQTQSVQDSQKGGE